MVCAASPASVTRPAPHTSGTLLQWWPKNSRSSSRAAASTSETGERQRPNLRRSSAGGAAGRGSRGDQRTSNHHCSSPPPAGMRPQAPSRPLIMRCLVVPVISMSMRLMPCQVPNVAGRTVPSPHSVPAYDGVVPVRAHEHVAGGRGAVGEDGGDTVIVVAYVAAGHAVADDVAGQPGGQPVEQVARGTALVGKP